MSESSSTLAGAPVLVTGGAGFIGSHLVDTLLAEGANVRVLDNLSTGLASNLSHVEDRIDFVEADLRDARAVTDACADRRFVFHLGALGSVPRSMEDPATTIAVNVSGTANVFTAARDAQVARVVYASSSSVYGDSPNLPKVEGEEGKPLSPYAWSKAMNEELAESFADSFGMQLVGMRYFNVYGPRQRPDGPYAAVIPRFFDAGVSGTAPIIHGDGSQSRDFTFVEDAARANLLAATSGSISGSVSINVAGGQRTTIQDLAMMVLEATASEAAPEYVASRPGDVPHSLADLGLARRLLGYAPGTSLPQGLASCYRHYGATLTAQ